MAQEPKEQHLPGLGVFASRPKFSIFNGRTFREGEVASKIFRNHKSTTQHHADVSNRQLTQFLNSHLRKALPNLLRTLLRSQGFGELMFGIDEAEKVFGNELPFFAASG
jgi:hypothetical protein